MLIERLKGVFMLNGKTFEEIEHDQTATSQAAIVVFGAALLNALISGSLSSDNFVGGFIGGLVATVLGWLLWSVVTWQIGTKLFGAKTDLGEMLRVIGFASAPSFIPFIGFFYSLAAAFVGAKEGLDLDGSKTFITVALGFIAMLALNFLLSIFGLDVSIFGMFR